MTGNTGPQPGDAIELRTAWGWLPGTVTHRSGKRIYYVREGGFESWTNERSEGSTWRIPGSLGIAYEGQEGGRWRRPGGSVIEIDAADYEVMSEHEVALVTRILQAGLPEPLYGRKQWQFDPRRNWRADIAWPHLGINGVICEVEGGTWKRTQGGRSAGHAHPKRFEEDCEKYTTASLMGITVVRVVPKWIYDGRALEFVRLALGGYR